MKKTKVLIAVAVVAAVGLGAVLFSTGDYFQGRLFSTRVSVSTTVTAESPSGNYMVSNFMPIAQFELCAKGSTVFVEKFNFDLYSSGSLNPDALLNPTGSYLKTFAVKEQVGVDPVGTYEVTSSDSSHIALTYKLGSIMEIKNNSCRKIEVSTNTTSLMNEQAGVDDILTLSLSNIATTNAANVSTNLPVSANTLKF